MSAAPLAGSGEVSLPRRHWPALPSALSRVLCLPAQCTSRLCLALLPLSEDTRHRVCLATPAWRPCKRRRQLAGWQQAGWSQGPPFAGSKGLPGLWEQMQIPNSAPGG